MPNPIDPNPAAPHALFGGKHIEVKFRDPAQMPERVFVREVPPSQYNTYLGQLHSMTGLVEFVCEKPRGWGDSLVFASLRELHQAIHEIHDPTFAPWLECMGPILAQMNRFASHSGESV